MTPIRIAVTLFIIAVLAIITGAALKIRHDIMSEFDEGEDYPDDHFLPGEDIEGETS